MLNEGINESEITQLLNDEGFKFLTGDINFIEYGGKWYKTDDNEGYDIIEIINTEDIGLEGAHKYIVDLSYVYLPDLEDHNLVSALECSGYNKPAYYHTIPDLIKVECLHSYGATDHIYDTYGNNIKPMIQHIIKALHTHPHTQEYKETSTNE